MNESNTIFDTLMITAHDLVITMVTGQLGPPMAGRMWIGTHSLDEILCPNQSERQVAILIAPGGPGETHIKTGQRTLSAEDLIRLSRDATAAGGSLRQGRLAVMTPALWSSRHRSAQRVAHGQTTLDAAKAAGWPDNCGNDPVLFLDDRSIYSLLAQANVGRTVTLLVGTTTEPGHTTRGSG